MVATYALGVVLIPKYLSQKMALQISAMIGLLFSFCIISTTEPFNKDEKPCVIA